MAAVRASAGIPAGMTLLAATALTGTGTHTFNARTKWVRLFLVAAGGGGGGGGAIVTKDTGIAPVQGGSGGAPGEARAWEGPVSVFGASAAFACGAGGAGATGKTLTGAAANASDSTNKPAGGAGGDTVFGQLKVKGGAGGGTGISAHGGSIGSTPQALASSYATVQAALNSNYRTAGGGQAQAGFPPILGASATINVVDDLFAGGGGAAGSWGYDSYTLYDGQAGGSSKLGEGGASGVSSVSADGTAGGNATAPLSVLCMTPGGGGGGGGAAGNNRTASRNATGGNGGNGALGGGGGGGGPGASWITVSQTLTAKGGNGGNGGNGGIAVLEFG